MSTSSKKLFKNIRKQRRRIMAVRKEIILNSKSAAISDAEMFTDFADIFGCKEPITDPASLADAIAREHRSFENDRTASETEIDSQQTAVGIGQMDKGRYKGCYVMVLNLEKKLGDGSEGLGFPGGRVRLGETPSNRVPKEWREETGLLVSVLNPKERPIAEHTVGEEEEHRFLAYEVVVVGGKTKPVFKKDEQIAEVVFVDEVTLEKACLLAGRIAVKGYDKVGVLKSHRAAFLEYLRKKRATKQEVSHV